jgi:hypothetical protein
MAPTPLQILGDHAKPDWFFSIRPTAKREISRQPRALSTWVFGAARLNLILFSPNGKIHLLEFRRLGEDLTAPQVEFRNWATRCGVAHSVVDSFDQLAVLDHWDCLRIKVPSYEV